VEIRVIGICSSGYYSVYNSWAEAKIKGRGGSKDIFCVGEV
jgi:hypothetical protein